MYYEMLKFLQGLSTWNFKSEIHNGNCLAEENLGRKLFLIMSFFLPYLGALGWLKMEPGICSAQSLYKQCGEYAIYLPSIFFSNFLYKTNDRSMIYFIKLKNVGFSCNNPRAQTHVTAGLRK